MDGLCLFEGLLTAMVKQRCSYISDPKRSVCFLSDEMKDKSDRCVRTKIPCILT